MWVCRYSLKSSALSEWFSCIDCDAIQLFIISSCLPCCYCCQMNVPTSKIKCLVWRTITFLSEPLWFNWDGPQRKDHSSLSKKIQSVSSDLSSCTVVSTHSLRCQKTHTLFCCQPQNQCQLCFQKDHCKTQRFSCVTKITEQLNCLWRWKTPEPVNWPRCSILKDLSV